MVYGFHCLRHHAVVGSNNNNCYIGYLGSPGTHRCKCFMSRSIEEGELPSVVEVDGIGADMLRYSSCFTCDDVGPSYIVEKFCLSMIDMAHNSYYWRTRFEIAFIIFCLPDSFLELGAYKFNLEAEFISEKSHGFGIETLVY